MSRYNGWTNYQTWAVKLWLDNEEGSYNDTRELAREAIEEADEWRTAEGLLADRLKEIHESYNPLDSASVYSDLLTSALGLVDWHEIAEAFVTGEREVMVDEAE